MSEQLPAAVPPPEQAGSPIPVPPPPLPTVPQPAAALPALPVTGLTDGAWHRLHPATPLLRGGLVLLAVIGTILGTMRDSFFDALIGRGSSQGNPIDWVVRNGYAGIALLVIFLGFILFVGGFFLSWRMHTFRITDEVVEVRSGILFRTNRRGRLDRIQGINIVRPFFARLLGAAKLEVNVAGQDANVQLSYLSSANADALRRDILTLASGTRPAPSGQGVAAQAAGVLDRRVSELLAPEFDPRLAPPEAVLKLHTGRLIGSILLSGSMLTMPVIIGGAIAAAVLAGQPFVLLGLFPLFIGIGSFTVSRFTKSLRYSIASTPDGVRVGFGLLSTSNETIPPGRIHSVQVSQPLLWRVPGWWEVKVNRASKSSTKGADGQQNTTILPVGNLADVLKLLGLLLPGLGDEESIELLRRGLFSRGGADGFVNSPRRAALVRLFSWRRNGFAFGSNVLLLRKDALWRQLVIVPQPRVQSIGLRQGPLARSLGLASVQLHTVAGPISAELGAVDRDAALAFFADASRAVIASASSDTSHRWRSGEANA